VFSVFRHFFEREFQFVHRFQAAAVVPRPARDADALLVASVFGTFPEEAERDFYQRAYVDTFNAVAVEITPETFAEVLLGTPRRYTPLRAASRRLEILPSARQQDLLFVLDPSDPLDLVDFWNLRALGLPVRPVPVNWIEPWADAYVSAHGDELANTTGWDSPNVIASLRLADEHRDQLMTALRERAGNEIELTRGFFPPLSNARSLFLNHFSRAEVTWRASDIEVTVGDERVQFECEGPPFAGDGMSYGPSWACVVNLRARLGGEIAEVFPPATGDITRDLDALGRGPITNQYRGDRRPRRRLSRSPVLAATERRCRVPRLVPRPRRRRPDIGSGAHLARGPTPGRWNGSGVGPCERRARAPSRQSRGGARREPARRGRGSAPCRTGDWSGRSR